MVRVWFLSPDEERRAQLTGEFLANDYVALPSTPQSKHQDLEDASLKSFEAGASGGDVIIFWDQRSLFAVGVFTGSYQDRLDPASGIELHTREVQWYRISKIRKDSVSAIIGERCSAGQQFVELNHEEAYSILLALYDND